MQNIRDVRHGTDVSCGPRLFGPWCFVDLVMQGGQVDHRQYGLTQPRRLQCASGLVRAGKTSEVCMVGVQLAVQLESRRPCAIRQCRIAG